MTEIEVNEPKIVGNWTYSELLTICEGCNGLRDCIHIPFEDSFKLFENYLLLAKMVKELQEKGAYIDGLQDQLAEQFNKDGQTDEVTKLGKTVFEKRKEFMSMYHEVELKTVPNTFPKDSSKYGIKGVIVDNQPAQLNTLKCYQDLKMFGVIV